MIYLDNAATTIKKPPQVAEAVINAMQTAGNSARGVHEGALAASRLIFDARVKLADFFGCSRPDHVIFTSNATAALNTALLGLLHPGDHAVSTDLEHNSVLRPLYRLSSERNVSVDFVPADRRGCIDYKDFERLIRPETKLIVCTHASNLTGNVTDLAAVSGIAHSHGALLVVDASQTAGERPVRMDELGADVICFTGHKGLYGPQGTGGLCIREGVEIDPFTVGGTGVQTYSKTQPEQYPARLEAGTLNAHGIAGLSAAVGFLNEVGLEAVKKREEGLARRFYEGVETIPGAHCAPRLHEALGTVRQGAVRFSFSYFTTEEEIDEAIDALRDLSSRT